MKLLEAIIRAFFPPKRKRLEIRFVDYAVADRLIRSGEWSLAKEEDKNRIVGMVWIERLEPLPGFSKDPKP